KISYNNASSDSAAVEILEILVRELHDTSYILRPGIFDKYFNLQDKITDSYKNLEGVGLAERFIYLMADELDQQFCAIADDFVGKVIDPKTLSDVYIPLWEYTLGEQIFSDL